MESREKIVDDLVEFLGHANFNAPYGITSDISEDKKYRNITFGIAGTLDAEIRVYGAKFLLLRWRNGSLEKFDNIHSLKSFIKDTWSYCFGVAKDDDGMIEF